MDHDRVNISQATCSCGVLELSRISSEIEEVLYAIGSRLYHPARGSPAAIIIWSDLNTSQISGELQGTVRANKLGVVEQTVFTENPKTGNIIALWAWTINHKMYKQWYQKKRIIRLGKVGG